ncbi:sulfate transporter [Thiohalorhabdus denitrificans]|uniref:Sulfate permease, SulP family n=1 Tax=Thiohalorhabdus denitrificans TaxID=381306 RepID=A0A0P9CQ85_9GAMM|nr:SulP family inorganic anion transporter [Thiohalorhabdus denitrificans]KPV41295.1 sulfate transporter [Thiohalorhabdus denitrificans]SCY22057.1 sulfate permease, SulP family [Thiohalorhabdus denitrificans]
MKKTLQAAWERQRGIWLFNVRGDLIAGAVVALALIPEAIAFSLVAGLDPQVGLYASFTMAVVIAFAGGRPGMISAATGAMALLVVDLVADHGLQYLLVATLLTGVIQILFAWAKLARYMMFIPRTVMVGFVNALAILIFLSQVHYLTDGNTTMWIMVGVGLALLYTLPHLPGYPRLLPAPLVVIVALTAVVWWQGLETLQVGDMGELPDGLPVFLLPDVPWTWETLQIVAPTSLALAVVGLLESLLTASIVDDLTDTPSGKNTESQGQGIANIVTGFFGGMASCAMIGQSMINIQSGGLGRLSTLAAGIYLLFFILVLGDLVSIIPMAALVAVMIMVSIATFDWGSLKTLHRLPRTDATVLVVTVATVVITHDLSMGVLAGVVLSAIFFARKMAKAIGVTSALSPDGRTRTYTVSGQLFFVAVDKFIDSFDYREPIHHVVLDLRDVALWDSSAVDAIDKVVGKFRRRGMEVDVKSPGGSSGELHDRLALHDKDVELGAGH